MSTAGPCERTMVWLRALGYTVDKVEQRVPHSARTRDCFGFADILAIGLGLGVLAVQATTVEHLMERVKKVQEEPRAALWLGCHNWIWVVGWGLKGERGARKLWVPRVVKFANTVDSYKENAP